VSNFIGKGEYRAIGEDKLFISPYSRIFFLHFFIFIGGFFVLLLGEPVVVVVVFIFFKTVFDIVAHNFAHSMMKDEK
jgi:uncharacterized membrane protein YjjP (DUF1212 family)